MIFKLISVRGEHKCRIFEMHLILIDQQLKIIMYIYREFYTKNSTVTTNQKSIIVTVQRERGLDITLKMVIKSQESKRRNKKNHKRN